ncbi:MAG TPA: amidohydrolase family protein [Candidatus Limnocylindria bacterium]|nr:amidohydrolase family protein [Candidatus Limnocylindria bacterium]
MPTDSATSLPSGNGRRRVLYRDAALADGRSPDLQVGVSVLVDDGRVAWIRPSDAEEDPGPDEGLEVVDASGSTIVPGMVDCHSHLTMPGGARWIERGGDSPERLMAYAEHNARLMLGAGVFWARDVGAPRGVDPFDGRERALSLGVRDRWAGRREYPVVRAAGTWLTRTGSLPAGLTVGVENADQLLAAATSQLDDGADFVKLYLDGPDPQAAPWSVAEVRGVVEAVRGRGARVSAHSGRLDGARVGAEAGVDSLEHGFELDTSVCQTMVTNGVRLVSTLTVFGSWLSFGRTTRIPRFASDDGRQAVEARRERAVESVRLARAAGVAICAGTDFGGGSARANQLAWEVESLVQAGLDPWEAMGAATWRGGELLGEPEAGTLREGGPADFFLVHGDPLSDPSALWRVWRTSR